MSKPNASRGPVIEFRVAVTTSDYDRLVRFYATGLGIEPAQLWVNDSDRAMLLELGKATIEIKDPICLWTCPRTSRQSAQIRQVCTLVDAVNLLRFRPVEPYQRN